jgi:hypothetical protein
MRDITRGGLGTILCELGEEQNVPVFIEESKVALSPPVNAVCEILGLDPLYLASEGKAAIIIPKDLETEARPNLAKHNIIFSTCLIFVCLVFGSSLYAQESTFDIEELKKSAPKVFFDCDSFVLFTRSDMALPRGEITLEEILLRRRELSSGYRYSAEVGLSYRFGSVFSNVVNPRFGNRHRR